MQRFHYDTIGSTNVEARALAAERPGEALLVTAAEQTAGRGRQGRAWHSPRGGAWLSIVWPMAHAPARYAASSLVVGAALRRAIGLLGGDGVGERLRIKWPNDLVVDDRKAAGILCEQCAGAAGTPGSLIIGIGVNVDFDPALFPADLRTPATTLRAALGFALAVDGVVAATAREVVAAMRDYELDGLGPELLAELRAALAYVGAMRRGDSPSGAVEGRVLGIDDAGRLLLETAGGTVACSSGELVG